ncbi:hypothetical protein HY450_00690 [Candidatus Pacearchaeota archaeon]|nr:hypothetical protein [Candidatus Pacearchaeota archaeon]
MKKILLSFFILILLAVSVTAANLEVEKSGKNPVVIKEINNPAIFQFNIDNKGATDDFEIYSLVGVSMGPKGFFTVPSGKSTLEVLVFPNSEMKKVDGFFKFEYQLKGKNSGIFKDELVVKVVSLKNVFEITAEPLSPSDSEATIILTNRENTKLENVNIKVDSIFFSDEEELSFEPFEEKELSVPISNLEGINAGPYLFNVEIKVQGENAENDILIDYLEESGLSVNESKTGFIVRQTTLTKKNVGNVPVVATIGLKKDFISRLFTTSSIPESRVERKGFSVSYFWDEELSPGESLVVISKTNYTFPFIVLVLLVIIIFFVKFYSQKALSLKKRVSLVRTKGGEFALKVNIQVIARKNVKNITITDQIPAMTKVYEKFGRQPENLDKDKGRLQWKLDSLTAGQERFYTYIVYSKLNVVGRFELPVARAVFEADGKFGNVTSNRAFFGREV